MNITEDLKDKILQGLVESPNNYGKIAKRHGTSILSVEYLDITVNGRYNYTPEGNGQEHLKHYMVAKQDLRQAAGWNNEEPRIKRARELYDEGKVEMVTGRDGFNLLLYAIPRHVPVKRKPYFAEVEQEPTNVYRLQ